MILTLQRTNMLGKDETDVHRFTNVRESVQGIQARLTQSFQINVK